MINIELVDRAQDAADEDYVFIRETALKLGFNPFQRSDTEIHFMHEKGYGIARYEFSFVDRGEEGLLEDTDRIRMLVKKLAERVAKQVDEGRPCAFKNSPPLDWTVSGERQIQKCMLNQAFGPMSVGVPNKGFKLYWLQRTNKAPAQAELDEGKVSKKIIYPDGSEIDDGWRHDLRGEFKKVFEQFGVYNRAPARFSKWSIHEADFGGEFEILNAPENMFTQKQRADLMVKAIAKKLIELAHRGYLIRPETRLAQAFGPGGQPIPSVDEVVRLLKPSYQESTDPRRPAKLKVYWIVESAAHLPKKKSP